MGATGIVWPGWIALSACEAASFTVMSLPQSFLDRHVCATETTHKPNRDTIKRWRMRLTWTYRLWIS
jgi:hypothetical protein